MYSTTNPGGVGHAWYRAAFIDPHRRGELGRTRFVPARVADNPFVNPEYARNLATLTGWQRSAWYDGSWDFAAGQFFSNFDPQRHVVAFAERPVAGTWVAGFDYGFAHYTVFLLAHADESGRLTVIDEVAVRGMVPEMAAQRIHACLSRQKLRACEVQVFSGADVCRRDAAGTTIAEQYRKLGIRLRPSSTDRVAGWAAVLHALGDPRQGVDATLFIHRRCEHLLTRLPAMQVDPNRSEDVLKVDCDDDGEGGDDSPDALRYLVAAKRNAGVVLRWR